jgi:hypothetical protein
MKSAAAILVLCAALPGCAVQLYGNQSTAAGTTTTVASSQVTASSATANARISFVSGQPVSPAAPGGQVRLSSGSAAGVLAAVVVIAGFFNSISGGAEPKPLPPDARIAHTCSCYGYSPPKAAAESE